MKKVILFSLAALLALAVSCKKEDKVVNSFIIDGVSKDIENIYLEKLCYTKDKNYNIFVSVDGEEDNIQFMLDGESHIGKEVDLSKKDPEIHQGWFWVFDYYGNGFDIKADGEPVEQSDFPRDTFESGTLLVKNLGEDKDGVPTLQISLKNGKVLDTDEQPHSVEFNFKGKVKLVELI